MKKLFTFLLVSAFISARAQTTIYSETFNSGSAASWTLNTSDEGGAPPLNNRWIINNVYVPGSAGVLVPNQPSGIVGYPHSNYMHMWSGPVYASIYGNNANYIAMMAGETFFTAMTTPISTVGYTGVTLSFWWLCNGGSTTFGKVFYRTGSGGTWTQITAPTATYYGNSTWQQQTITMAALDNVAFLEFGFQFTDGTGGGSNPAFAIDDIKVTGNAAATVPTASYTVSPHDTACANNCITFASTSAGGAVDSIKWSIMPPVSMTSSTTTPVTICFPTPQAYTVTLTAYGAGGSTNAVRNMCIMPAPTPTITKAGHTLTVPTCYASYQWYKGTTAIAAATNNTYTYSSIGDYTVMVDSGGCKGKSKNNINTASIVQVGSAENVFRTTRSENGLTLWSKELLRESINISIYDAAGRLIVEDLWNEGSDMKVFSDLSLMPGLYIIRLNDNTGNSLSLKFIE